MSDTIQRVDVQAEISLGPAVAACSEATRPLRLCLKAVQAEPANMCGASCLSCLLRHRRVQRGDGALHAGRVGTDGQHRLRRQLLRHRGDRHVHRTP